VIHNLDVPTTRAATWALLTLHQVRRSLRRGELQEVDVRPPPPLPEHAVRGVHAVLRRRPHTCLERSLLLQRWYAARGDVRDVVIGVTPTVADFGAHAWLDGEPEQGGPFEELSRIRLRGTR
jgi:hypothetical protein